jgi:ATP-dependent RNA helicase RhlE
MRPHEKDPELTSFSELGLAAAIVKAIGEEGYSAPTPIQSKAIPRVLAGSDLLGIAQTGTGKTAAFALPIIHRLGTERRTARRKGCRVLVLSPTRELATQIGESFLTYGRHLKIAVAVVFGGVAHRPQVQALARGVDVLIATPGRLLDHLGQGTIALEGTEVLVLDEADQMLDLGFLQPIRRIVARLSPQRQNLFFSATMPGEIGKLADELLRNPVKVAVAPAATTVERVTQRVIHVEANKKRALLVELLADARMSRTLVFTRTKRGADRVARHLEGAGLCVAAIHGNKSQRQREAALDAFRRSEIRVLVATDIAARGIDIDQVSHVVNYELPDVPESYVHRIGRTARAGAVGIAISLCDVEERGQLREIERITRQAIPAEDRRKDEQLAADGPSGPPKRRHHRSDTGRELRDRPTTVNGQRHGEGRRQRRHAAGQEDAGPRQERDGRVRPAPAGGRSGLDGVAFLARPIHRTRPDGSDARQRAGHRQATAGGCSKRHPSVGQSHSRRVARD